MLLPVGIRLPHMLDPVAEAGERAARLADAPPRPIEPPPLRPNPSLSVDPVTGLGGDGIPQPQRRGDGHRADSARNWRPTALPP